MSILTANFLTIMNARRAGRKRLGVSGRVVSLPKLASRFSAKSAGEGVSFVHQLTS